MAGAGGVELAVHDFGPPTLPPAVIAHGVASTPRFVRETFAAPMAALGYRVVSYDLRGHGASTAPDDLDGYALEHQAADLAAVVSAVGADLFGGISLGAHAAARLAAGRDGLAGVVLCMPGWTDTAVAGEGPHAAVAAEIRAVGVAGALARIRADETIPGWLRTLLDRDWSSHPEASLGDALIALDGADGPTGADLASISAPTGVVGWPDDPGHPLEVATAWAAVIPRGVLVTTSLDALGEGKSALGAAAVRALLQAGI